MAILEKSFKNWFKIMWMNRYIQLFVTALVLAVLELCNIDWCLAILFGYNDTWSTIFGAIGLSIPWLIMLCISYFGFYKFWKELTK